MCLVCLTTKHSAPYRTRMPPIHGTSVVWEGSLGVVCVIHPRESVVISRISAVSIVIKYAVGVF